MKHRLYIDEVGNHDLGVSVHTTERFLSLSGILISLDHVKDVVGPDLERLKKVYFSRHHPDSPLIFHRKELMNASHPFGELKNPDKLAGFMAISGFYCLY